MTPWTRSHTLLPLPLSAHPKRKAYRRHRHTRTTRSPRVGDVASLSAQSHVHTPAPGFAHDVARAKRARRKTRIPHSEETTRRKKKMWWWWWWWWTGWGWRRPGRSAHGGRPDGEPARRTMEKDTSSSVRHRYSPPPPAVLPGYVPEEGLLLVWSSHAWRCSSDDSSCSPASVAYTAGPGRNAGRGQAW